jgi:hypothetical protein
MGGWLIINWAVLQFYWKIKKFKSGVYLAIRFKKEAVVITVNKKRKIFKFDSVKFDGIIHVCQRLSNDTVIRIFS